MDKPAENMDEISSSPAFSDPDELLQWDNFSDDLTVTCPGTYTPMSKDGISLDSASWCCSSDSDISEVITALALNVHEEIRKVANSFWNPETLETEEDDSGEQEDLSATETGSTSRVAIESEESLSLDLLAPSSPTSTTIIKAAKELVSQVAEEAVSALQFTGWHKHKIHPAPLTHLDEVIKAAKTATSSCAAADTDLSSTPLELADYMEDETPGDIRNVVSPLLSTTSVSPNHQVDCCTFPEDPSNQAKDAKARRSSGFLRSFRSIFSKNEKKEKKEKAPAEKRVKRFCHWKQMLPCIQGNSQDQVQPLAW